MDSHGDDALRGAVSGVLSAGGAEVLDQPARFRSMLSDLLGAESSSLRDEQSLLVTMVEQGLARELVAAPLTPEKRSDLIARMRADGGLEDTRVSSALSAFDKAVGDAGLRAATTGPTLSPEVVAGLGDVLTAGGRDVLQQPARFRSMLADVLGPIGSSFRTEQTTLVGIVEQGVGVEILSRSPSADERTEIVSRLHTALDSTPTELQDGIEALDRAVTITGLRDSDAGDASPVPTFIPAAAVPEAQTSPPATTTDESPVFTAAVATAPPAPTSWDGSPPAGSSASNRRRRRAPVLIALAAFVTIGLVALVAVLVSRSGNPTSADVAFTFPTEDLTFAQLERSWKVTDGVLVGTLDFTNDRSDKTQGRYTEAFPKTLAPSADAIQSDPKPSEVLKADPVVAWDISLDPSSSTTITYRIVVPDGTDDAQLQSWSRDQRKTLADYQAEQTKKPSLVVSSPADGTVFDVPEADLVGTTDPVVTLDVNGFGIPVNTDGSWKHHTTDMAVGANPFVFTAVGANGQTAQVAITLVYTPPAPEPVTPRVDPQVTGDGGGNRTVDFVTCWDGSSARDASGCPAKPVTCPDGSAAADAAQCPKPPVPCWDGSSAPTYADCPPKPPQIPDFTIDGPATIYSGYSYGCASDDPACYTYRYDIGNLSNVSRCTIWMAGVFDPFDGLTAYYWTYYSTVNVLSVTCYSSQGLSTTKTLTITAV